MWNGNNQRSYEYAMIIFKRYPHVRDLIIHYANHLQENQIISFMNTDITNAAEAITLVKFIWRMANQMAIDNENNIVVLGRTDNSDIMPDVDYEISQCLSNKGYGDIWDRICDES